MVNVMGCQEEITRQEMNSVGSCSALRHIEEDLRLSRVCGISLGNRSVIFGKPLGSDLWVPSRHAASDRHREWIRMLRSDNGEHIECFDLGQELLYHVLGNCTD